MKHLSRAVAACALAAAGVLSGPAMAETLNWVTYKARGAGDPQAITTQWFADELERRTKGEYKIRIHWGGSVAGMGEIPTAIAAGTGDIGDVVTPYFPDELPVNNAISFFWPQPHSSIELGLLMTLWHETYPQFAEELASKNLIAVGMRPLEPYGMICTKPIRSVEDFKGLRIRSFGFALPAVIEALEAVPVSMTTADAYEALSRGILDCSPVGATLAHGWKYDEVAKYYVDIPLGASWGHLITMNLDKFKSFPEEIQTEIMSIGREYLVRYTVAMQRGDDEVRELWARENKVEVIPFAGEDFTARMLADPKVRQVRADWVTKASATGLDVTRIVETLEAN